MGLTFATKRRRRFLRWRTLIVVVVLGAIGAGVFVVLQQRDDSKPPLPTSEVNAFLAAWSAGDANAMGALLDLPPKDLATTATSLVRARSGNRASYTRTGLMRDATDDKQASATYHARVDIAGFGPVVWDGTLRLVRVKQDKREVWRIQYAPDTLYPGLRTGQHLDLRVTWPARGSILAADGSLLAGAQSVVTIGLEPDRVTQSLDQIKQLLKDLVGTDPASIDAALHAPGVQPNFFVAVATVPDDARYATVLRPRLSPVPGVFFHREQGVLTTSTSLAPLVGRLGEITAERLKQLGAPYRTHDQVGLTGLQAAYEKRLAGTPTADVVVEAGNTFVRRVQRFRGKAGQSVRVTIDPRVQQAADAALTGVAQPAALVAIDVTNGRLRAVVSKPDGGFNRALAGTYEPGSTFKVVTSAALLANGSTAATPAPCPPTLQVYGRVFRNFEGEASGSLDLASAFKISCNNAFIGLADKLPAGALARAATQFGFNAPSALPPPAAGGSFPEPKDRAELAASSIGQGRVLVSPAHMASVAAAVAAAQWHSPVLTTEPKPKVSKVAAIDAGVAATLREFMASVVQSGGTAAGAGLPPGTFGKTGTAEFGTANPPQTHAWFIGFRGNLAFAVVVEGGGVGGRVAAPLAAKFLNAMP